MNEETHVKHPTESNHHHYLDVNGKIRKEYYKTLIIQYSLYNPSLVTFLCEPNLGLTPYESILCVFSYEHLSIKQMEQILGKNRGALNKAILRIREKITVRLRKNQHKKIDSLSDFLRSRF